MPSSGYGMEDFFSGVVGEQNLSEEQMCQVLALNLINSAKVAMEHGLFVEWLECFVSAWNKTKDPWIAAEAGLIEWDM